MSWISHGMVFRIKDWKSNTSVGAFAQSPQALVLPDRVRVYFSTRYRDLSGNWVSKVSFIDFTRDFADTIGEPEQVGIETPALGTFDEHGIFPFSVVPIDGEVWAYATGWSRRTSVAVETSIGLMKSCDDGRTFVRHGTGGPILSSNLHEPFLVGDGFVRRVSGRWLMWYIFGTHWREDPTSRTPERTYKIGVAKSDDGMSWTPSQGIRIIPDVLGEEESQALPSVLDLDGVFHMVFCYRETFDFRATPTRGYRLGYASSNDGLKWERNDDVIQLEPSTFDCEMRCYPNLFLLGDRVFMLYNGNDFGRQGFGLAEWLC